MNISDKLYNIINNEKYDVKHLCLEIETHIHLHLSQFSEGEAHIKLNRGFKSVSNDILIKTGIYGILDNKIAVYVKNIGRNNFRFSSQKIDSKPCWSPIISLDNNLDIIYKYMDLKIFV